VSERSANIERIADWIDGRLAADEAAAVAAAVAADPAAGELAGLYRAARTTVAGDRSEAPSDALIARLRAIGATARPAAGALGRLAAATEARLAAALADLGAVPRVIAELVHDSRRAQPGLRGAAAPADASSFLAAWTDGDLELELQIDRRGDAWAGLGQISSVDGGSPDVRAIRCVRIDEAETATTVSATPDEGGVFECRLGSGTWAVIAVLPDRVVVVDRLHLDRGDPSTA
jgi:hypothetical protein